MLVYHKTTQQEKYAISEWKYGGEYAVYDLPPYEEQIKTHSGFANPKNNFYSFTDGDDLIGYINLTERETGVFLGIGVNPAFCDRGHGQKICKAACELSRRSYPGKQIYIEVRTWNIRAVRCYEKAGFRTVGEPVRKNTPAGEGLFYRMTVD